MIKGYKRIKKIVQWNIFYDKRSITIADAPPPPLQIAAAPILASFCSNTLMSVMRIRTPEHPSGCPKETAPPLTLVLASESPRIFKLANPTTENASLNSKKSTSLISIPDFSSALGSAFAGAVVNHLGS